MLKLYGSSQSRSVRVLWTLNELGLQFEHFPVLPGQARTPEHLKRNPNGHVPVLDDNGQLIFESLAINMHLAEAYGSAPFWPATLGDRATLYQWTLWSQTEVEWAYALVLRHTVILPPEQRSAEVVEQVKGQFAHPLGVLNNYLSGRQYLIGETFSVADLNVAGMLRTLPRVKVELSAYPALFAWLNRCLEREAYQKALKMP